MKISILNILLLLVIVALALALALYHLSVERKVEFVAANHTHSWSLSESQIKNSPEWRVASGNPPVSLSDAAVMAKKLASKMDEASKTMNIGSWHLESLSLIPIDNRFVESPKKWCYLLEYHGYHLPIHGGAPYGCSIILLMDGSIVIGDDNSLPLELDEKMREMLTE